MVELTAKTYLDAFKTSLTHCGITGGTIHDFIRESHVVYHYDRKCPVWYIEHNYNGKNCIVAGNYATNKEESKPKLRMFEQLDFS